MSLNKKTVSKVRWQDLLSFGFGVFSILLYFAILRLLDVPQPVAISVAVAMSYLGLLIQMRVDKADVIEQIQSLSSDARVRLVGNNEQANLEITPKCARARSVQNTFIGLTANHYDREMGKKANHAQYSSWLANSFDGHWVDVVGPTEKDDGRFTQIFLDKPIGQHTVYMLDREIPVMNFIIFEYPEGGREVYFGWMAGIRPEDSAREIIHSSTDQKVVELFELHFKQLIQASGTSRIIDHRLRAQ